MVRFCHITLASTAIEYGGYITIWLSPAVASRLGLWCSGRAFLALLTELEGRHDQRSFLSRIRKVHVRVAPSLTKRTSEEGTVGVPSCNGIGKYVSRSCLPPAPRSVSKEGTTVPFAGGAFLFRNRKVPLWAAPFLGARLVLEGGDDWLVWCALFPLFNLGCPQR
jgi:hypothetical protein